MQQTQYLAHVRKHVEMYRIFLCVICTFALTLNTHAQTLEWSAGSAHSSNTSLSSIARHSSGDTYVLSAQDIWVGTGMNYGRAMLSVYSASADLRWTVSLEGSLVASDMLLDGDRLWICGHIDSALIYQGVTYSGPGFFMMQCGTDGTLHWLNVVDTLEGDHSRITLSPEGLPVVSALRGWFDSSMLMMFDFSGEVQRSRVLPLALVSDMAFAESGALLVCGSAFLPQGFDDIVIDTFIQYPNYLACFDAQWNAEWVYVSEYITFDHHHRLQVIGDRVYYFEQTGITFTLMPSITAFDLNGNILVQHALTTTDNFPQVEFAVIDERLIVFYDTWNYSNPLVPDSMLLQAFDGELQPLWSFPVTGHFPQFTHAFTGQRAFQLEADDCHLIIGVLPEHEALVFGDTEISLPQGVVQPYVLAGLDIDCMPSSVKDKASTTQLIFYPNPVNAVLHFEYDQQPHHMILMDVLGNFILGIPAGTQQVDVSHLIPGTYIIAAQYDRHIEYQKIVVINK